MTFISRAIRYILRKRIKTAIVFIIVFLISTLLFSTSAVSNAAGREGEKVEAQAESSFVLANNPQINPGTPRGAGTVKPKDVQAIAKLNGIASYVVRQNVTADLVNAKAARIPGVQEYDNKHEQQFGNAVNIEGTNDSTGLNTFKTKAITMSKGKHLIANNVHASLIHEDLAKANGLHVGDTLTLRANPYDADNIQQSTATVKTRIVGIYAGANKRQVATRAELTANTVYTDLQTTRELYKYKPGKEIYQDASFRIKRGEDADNIMSQAAKLPIDLQNYQLTRDDQFVSGLLKAAKGVRSIMTVTTIAVVSFAIIALALVLLLWMNERRNEIGVFVAIGTGKLSIVGQYLAEIVLIAIPSLIVGYLFAKVIAPLMANVALGSVQSSAARELSNMGQAGGNLESTLATKTLETLSVQVDAQCFVGVSTIVGAVIVIAVVLSYLPIICKSPRELLGLQK